MVELAERPNFLQNLSNKTVSEGLKTGRIRTQMKP